MPIHIQLQLPVVRMCVHKQTLHIERLILQVGIIVYSAKKEFEKNELNFHFNKKLQNCKSWNTVIKIMSVI